MLGGIDKHSSAGPKARVAYPFGPHHVRVNLPQTNFHAGLRRILFHPGHIVETSMWVPIPPTNFHSGGCKCELSWYEQLSFPQGHCGNKSAENRGGDGFLGEHKTFGALLQNASVRQGLTYCSELYLIYEFACMVLRTYKPRI